MNRSWPFAFYLAYFAAAVFIQPNIIVYYQKLGLTGMQIGLMAGLVPLIITLGAPFWTGLGDANNRHKLIMSVTILVTVVIASFFPLIDSLALIIPLVI